MMSYDIIFKFNFRFEISVSNLVPVRHFNSKSWIEVEIMQCGLKIHRISTIGLNKKTIKKTNQQKFFNSVLRYGKLRDSSLTYFSVFVVLYREIVKNID